jgi:hypothetical protein
VFNPAWVIQIDVCFRLQQLQLRCLPYGDGIARNRSDLLRIELIANGEHQLQIFVLRGGRCHGAEDIHYTVLQGPH